jgi:hypothetical protein
MQRTRINKVLSTLLTAFTLASLFALFGLLAACGGGGGGGGGVSESDTSNITEIRTFRQTEGGIAERTTYQAIFKQTPEEWNALSDEDRETLAQMGFEQIIEQIKTDEVSNYGIQGMTSPAAEAENASAGGQLAFMLYRDEGGETADVLQDVLLIYTDADGTGNPVVATQVVVDLSSLD